MTITADHNFFPRTIRNILLVDDDAVNNFVNTKNLLRSGLAADIKSVEDGSEALKLFGSYYQPGLLMPDLILLDINMPVMNGFQFLDAFGKLDLPFKERIKIIVLSSSDNSHDVALAKKMGAFQYVVKPLMTSDIVVLLTNNILSTH